MERAAFREGMRSGARMAGPACLAVAAFGAGVLPTVAARWLFGFFATVLAAAITYYVFRVERDYIGVRRIFRDATAKALRAADAGKDGTNEK